MTSKYRVTIPLVQNLPLTSKTQVPLYPVLAWPGQNITFVWSQREVLNNRNGHPVGYFWKMVYYVILCILISFPGCLLWQRLGVQCDSRFWWGLHDEQQPPHHWLCQPRRRRGGQCGIRRWCQRGLPWIQAASMLGCYDMISVLCSKYHLSSLLGTF